ncbi:MAG: glycosyltransferase family 4 protein, partial [Candidatus Bathyarchaeia archaeon]
PSVKFLIAGHDNNIPKMLQMCRQLGVESHFKFLGWVPNEEVQKLYWEASVFVMPSLSEAFGVAILEAMASGTPVVATRVGGIPELVEHNVNGLLVEPNNYKALAEAILTVLENTDIAARLGQQGRITAQRFGLEQMIKCTYRVYEAILSDS